MKARNLNFKGLRLIMALALYGALFGGSLGDVYAAPQSGILRDILEKAKYQISEGHRPVMIFDLDDTIFDAGSRTLFILKEMAKEAEFKALLPDLMRQLSSLTNDDVQYEFSDNLDMLGIFDSTLRAKATTYWSNKFFNLCDIDAIHQEAKDFVLRAHAEGTYIVYLTGRDQPGMQNCTVKSLRSNGLPLDNAASLMLKPDKSLPDVIFKQAAFKDIEKLGTVVAGFDNEPANVNAMVEKFPEAEIVFIATRHSNRPDQPLPSILLYKWTERR